MTSSDRILRFGRPMLLVLVGLVMGAALTRPGPALFAQSEKRPGPAHFKSGSERSEVVLQEIAATLKQIDRRLERMENALMRASEE